jgi:hypothetical protein
MQINYKFYLVYNPGLSRMRFGKTASFLKKYI